MINYNKYLCPFVSQYRFMPVKLIFASSMGVTVKYGQIFIKFLNVITVATSYAWAEFKATED